MRCKHENFYIFGLIIILFVVSCQSIIEPPATTFPVESLMNTATPQTLLESVPLQATVTTSSTDVHTPTEVLVFATEIVTVLPEQTVSTNTGVTITPLPTLKGEQLQIAIAQLVANPMDCNIPCWWKAVPGVTSIDEIKHTLAPYNFDIYEYEDEQITYLRVGIGEKSGDFEIRIGYSFSDAILTRVSAYSPSISEVLSQYGSPDEVWIETMSIMRETLPVRLNMVYLQAGIAVGYVVDGDILDNKIIGCFANEEKGRLDLITINSAVSYQDFPTVFEDDRYYLSLEEATSLTIMDFMEDFSDPSAPQCIETPTELWD